MPAYCTHYIFACQMMPRLNELANFKLNEDAVLLGTQGPDIFFFHRITPWMVGKSLRKAGSAMHRAKPGDILDTMAEYCKKSKNPDIAHSYVYGFILHYGLDRKCHPFVYSLQERIKNKNKAQNAFAIHNTIEMAMDSVMINRELKINKPNCFNTAITVPDTNVVLYEIGLLLEYVVPRVTSFVISQRDGIRALKDTKYAQKLLHDESGKKITALRFAENVTAPLTRNFVLSAMFRPKDLEKAKKYGNICNSNWQSPYERGIRNESFFDLYNLAKKDCIELIKGFKLIERSEKNGSQITNNLSFLTGVELK